jgi:hypothetical protein
VNCKVCDKKLRADNKIGVCRKHRAQSEAQKAYMNQYATKNAVALKEYMGAYRKQHKDRINQRFYDRLKTEPCIKLRHAIRTRLNRVLRRQGLSDTKQALFGCTFDELVAHIEQQFAPGMTWDNHGVSGWHIDHIMPLSKFDLSDPQELARAQHYTNLRPMWAADNIRKRDRLQYSQECPAPRTGDDVR